MAETWQWLGSLFNAEGHNLMVTVVRWIMVYAIPIVAVYMFIGHLIDRKIKGLEKRARQAVESGRHEEALKAYARSAFLILVFRSLYGQRWSMDDWNESLGDLFFERGKYPSAVFFYTRAVSKQLGREEFWTYLENPVALAPGLEISVHDAPLYKKLGYSLLKSGCAEEAIIWLQRAVSSDRSTPSTWLALSEAYERIGNSQLASECKQRAEAISGQQQNDVAS